MTLGISRERRALLPSVEQSWEVLRARAPTRSGGQLLSTPLPGPQEGWLVPSKGSENGMLLTSCSVLGQPATVKVKCLDVQQQAAAVSI